MRSGRGGSPGVVLSDPVGLAHRVDRRARVGPAYGFAWTIGRDCGITPHRRIWETREGVALVGVISRRVWEELRGRERRRQLSY